MALANSQPSASPTPDHSAAPMPSNTMNGTRRTPVDPAIAVATLAKPGTNFATTSDGAPKRAKMDSVWRTQPSWDSDSLHRPRSTCVPKRLPAAYQSPSAIRQANTAVATSATMDCSPRAAAAPATRNTG